MAVEIRDPAIKLFGKTIQLHMSSGDEEDENLKDLNNKEASFESKDNDQESQESRENFGPPTSSTDHESPKSSVPDQENASPEDSKHEESPNETNGSQEKPPKPDKILPCPRCKSLETKFCYYNNYNVNQPRHFCKNCQRYWTAGGTMRNVPVGAGRRRNKSSSSHYPHIAMSDTYFQVVQHNVIPPPISHLPSKPDGTILNFGSNMPLYESLSSVHDIAKKAMKNDQCNGFQKIDQKKNLTFAEVEIADEQSSESLAAPPSSNDGTRGNLPELKMQNRKEVPTLPCFNSSPLPYPIIPLPAFCNSGFSFPFYPAMAYWGCAVPGTWPIPWPSPVVVPSPNCNASGYRPNSSNLGKHSREGDLLNNCKPKTGADNEQSKQERRLWVPKTIRIDNPEEAAKSSIWAMLGIRNDKTDKTSGGLFKPFQRQPVTKNHNAEASQVLHANPAALSRSLSFQESL